MPILGFLRFKYVVLFFCSATCGLDAPLLGSHQTLYVARPLTSTRSQLLGWVSYPAPSWEPLEWRVWITHLMSLRACKGSQLMFAECVDVHWQHLLYFFLDGLSYKQQETCTFQGNLYPWFTELNRGYMLSLIGRVSKWFHSVKGLDSEFLSSKFILRLLMEKHILPGLAETS